MEKPKSGNNKNKDAYPKPAEKDIQLKNQPEFIDQQPNDFKERPISEVPASDAAKQSNDPFRGKQE